MITGCIELCCEWGKGTVVVAVEPGIEDGTDGVTGVTADVLFTGFTLLLGGPIGVIFFFAALATFNPFAGGTSISVSSLGKLAI